MVVKDTTTLIIASILCLIIVTLVYNHYNPTDRLLYCMRKIPQYNDTYNRDCYTIYWAEFCKVRAPQLCPDYIKNKPQAYTPFSTNIS